MVHFPVGKIRLHKMEGEGRKHKAHRKVENRNLNYGVTSLSGYHWKDRKGDELTKKSKIMTDGYIYGSYITDECSSASRYH